MAYNKQAYVPRFLEENLREAVTWHPVVAVVSPRQCGKSTLVRHCLSKHEDLLMLTLDRPSDLRKLAEAEFFLYSRQWHSVCIA